MKAVSYLVEKKKEEELRALCQRRARSCHHHWQHRVAVGSGTRVTNPTKDSGGGGGVDDGGGSCRQTKRTRWKARRWGMSVVTEMTKTVNSDGDGCCCKQRSELVASVVAAGNSGAGDEGGKTGKGRRSSGDQGRMKTDGGCCHCHCRCCERRGKQTTGTKETKRGWGDWVTRQRQKRLTRWRKVGKDKRGGRGMTLKREGQE